MSPPRSRRSGRRAPRRFPVPAGCAPTSQQRARPSASCSPHDVRAGPVPGRWRPRAHRLGTGARLPVMVAAKPPRPGRAGSARLPGTCPRTATWAWRTSPGFGEGLPPPARKRLAAGGGDLELRAGGGMLAFVQGYATRQAARVRALRQGRGSPVTFGLVDPGDRYPVKFFMGLFVVTPGEARPPGCKRSTRPVARSRRARQEPRRSATAVTCDRWMPAGCCGRAEGRRGEARKAAPEREGSLALFTVPAPEPVCQGGSARPGRSDGRAVTAGAPPVGDCRDV